MPNDQGCEAGRVWAAWYDGLQRVRQRDARAGSLVRAKHYIDRLFSGAVPLDTMADRARLSKYHFVRAFRDIFQQTPHRYLVERRIARARELLERTELSVTAICFWTRHPNRRPTMINRLSHATIYVKDQERAKRFYCRKSYEELKAKGVEFLSPPKERPYGVEATFQDDSGNWFSLTQH